MARHIDLKPIEDEAPGMVEEVVDEGKEGSPWVPSRARCGGLWLHWTGWKMNAVIPHFIGQWFTVMNGSTYYASHPGIEDKDSSGAYFNVAPLFGQELVYQYSEDSLVKGLRAATLVRLVNLLVREGVIGGVKQASTVPANSHEILRELARGREAQPMYPGVNLYWHGQPPYTTLRTPEARSMAGISRVEPELAQARTTEEVLAYWAPRLDSESMTIVSGLVARARSRAPDSSWMSMPELGFLSHLTSGEVTGRLAILFRSPVNLVEMHPSGLRFRARRDTLFLDQPQPASWSPRYFYHLPYTSGVAVPSGMTQGAVGEGGEQQAIQEAQQPRYDDPVLAAGFERNLQELEEAENESSG